MSLPIDSTALTWDHMNRKQSEKAKKQFIKAKQDLRLIVNDEDKPVETFAEVADLGYFKVKEKIVSPTSVIMTIINEKGDETIVWDAKNKKEVEKASKAFNKYIEQGWKAYAVYDNGEKWKRIKKFDASLEEIVFDEDGFRKSLLEFAKSFKKVQVVPKTFPG